MAIITAKPYDQMTLAELREEHDRWVAACTAPGWGAQIERAHLVRGTLATWIARREREAARVA